MLARVLYLATLVSLVLGLALENGGAVTTDAATTVWFTTTEVGGAILTLPSVYSQEFKETYTEATAAAPTGGILEVSSVGQLRTYETTTVTNIANTRAYSGLIGLLALGSYLLG